MPTGLLKTKLYRPSVRDSWVARPRLRGQLDRGLHEGERLILISAPAGYGKTTLLAEWLASRRIPAAWLSLDEQDNDPIRFWMYVIAALQTLASDLGKQSFELLQSPQPPPIPLVLSDLLNEVTNLSDPTVLILDDYHLISATAIHDSVAYVLDHLPRNLHLALSTRADPPLPLARLRARDQVVELRAADLRFTTDEALNFLNQAMDLNLPLGSVESLLSRTEGWAVGLQLAALSLQGQADPRGYIDSFTGGHHYVLEYLVEEVLNRQPERVQRFLAQTSILERLCGPLCDALTGETGGTALLAELYRANLFLVPLDDQHFWYRYHHLFRDLLQARLQQSNPDAFAGLQLRASEWCDQNGLATEAVQYALAAKEYARVADLIEQHAASRWALSDTTFLTTIGKLPIELIESRPALAIHHGFVLVLLGQHQAAERLLQALRRHIPANPDLEMKGISSFATVLLSYIADLTGQESQEELPDPQLLQYVPEHRLAMRNTADVTYAFLLHFRGEFDRAAELLMGAVRRDIAANGTTTIPIAISRLARMRVVQGRLHETADLCRTYIRQVQERGAWRFYIAGSLNIALADVLREWNDLENAEREVRRGIQLNEPWPSAESIIFGYLVLARVLLAEGRLDGAVEMLQQADRAGEGRTISPHILPDLRGLRVRLWLAQGKIDATREWAETFPFDGPFDFRHEGDRITRARVWLAEGRASEALALLGACKEGARAGGRGGRQIEIGVLNALALEALHRQPEAFQELEMCLGLAEPEGYVRVFLDEPGVAELLWAYVRAPSASYKPYAFKLLKTSPVAAPASRSSAAQGDLVEPLTPRELEVLRLICTGDSNQAIADRLVITVSAVKKHTGNILGKLGVTSRAQAMVKARQLGLVPKDR